MIAEDGYISIINGNYVEDKDGKRPEAIKLANQIHSTRVGYYAINGTTTRESIYKDDDIFLSILSLINNTNSKTIIDDQIVGESTGLIDGIYYSDGDEKQYVELNEDGTYHDIETPGITAIENSKLNITGDGTGLVQLNNNVINLDITLDNSTLHLGLRDNILDNNNLTLESGTLSMINNHVGVSSLSSLHLYGTTDFLADVDLAKSEMDRFITDVYCVDPDAKLNVVGMNLLSDAPKGRDVTEIYFAQKGLKDNVVYDSGELPHTNVQTTAYTPIYKYNIIYDNRDNGGYFLFSRGAGGSNSSGAYNPSVLSAPVATQAAGHSAMNESFRYVFQHADAFTQLPAMERFTKINSNRYAAASTDFNQNIEWDTELHNQGVWVRPYTTFEKIDLKNGPNVDAVTYGTLVGYDSDFRHLKNGWTNVGTGYLGYMGSQLNYSGVDTSMNGGRTGIALTAGFRWALGVDDKNAKTSQKVRKVLKETKTKLTSK